jgi:hypothetical protein
MILNGRKAPRPLVEQMQSLRLEEDVRIGGWQLEYLPSLNFYVQRNIEHLRDEQAVASFLGAPLRVYLFIPLEEWQRMAPSLQGAGRIVGQHEEMYHHTQVVVVTNR